MMIIFILLLISIFSGITTYILTTLFAMILTDNFNIIKIYIEFSPLNLIDKYSPDRSFKNKLIKIISRYIFYFIGIIGIIISILIHRIIHDIFEGKYKNPNPSMLVIHKVGECSVEPEKVFKDLKNINHYSIIDKTTINEEELDHSFEPFISDNVAEKNIFTWNIIIDDTLKEELYYKDLKQAIEEVKTATNILTKFNVNYIDDISNIDQYLYKKFVKDKNPNQEVIVITDIRNQIELNSQVFKHLVSYIDTSEWINNINYIKNILTDIIINRTV